MPDLIQIPKPELGRPNDSRLTQAYLDARPELKGLTPFNPATDFDLVDMINDRLGQLHALVQYADADLYGAVNAARDSAVQAAQDAQDNIAAVNAEWADTKSDIAQDRAATQAATDTALNAAGIVPWYSGDHTTLPGGVGAWRIMAGTEAGQVWQRSVSGGALSLSYTPLSGSVIRFPAIPNFAVRDEITVQGAGGLQTFQAYTAGAFGLRANGTTDNRSALQSLVDSGENVVFEALGAAEYAVDGFVDRVGLTGAVWEMKGGVLRQQATRTRILKLTDAQDVQLVNLRMRAAGEAATEWTGTSANNGRLLWLEGGDGVTVRGGKLRGGGYANLYAHSVANLTIDGVEFIAPAGISGAIGDGNFQFNLIVSSNWADEGREGLVIRNCRSVGGGQNYYVGPGYVGAQITGNRSYNALGQHGYYLNPAHDMYIAGNYAIGSRYLGMKLQASFANNGGPGRDQPVTFRNVQIVGNMFRDCGQQGLILSQGDTPGQTVSGTIVQPHLYLSPIVSGNSMHNTLGLILEDARDIIAEKNVVEDAGQYGLGLRNITGCVHVRVRRSNNAAIRSLDPVSGGRLDLRLDVDGTGLTDTADGTVKPAVYVDNAGQTVRISGSLSRGAGTFSTHAIQVLGGALELQDFELQTTTKADGNPFTVRLDSGATLNMLDNCAPFSFNSTPTIPSTGVVGSGFREVATAGATFPRGLQAVGNTVRNWTPTAGGVYRNVVTTAGYESSAYPTWTANTAYTVGTVVFNGSARIYQCITAGTSGSTVPTGAPADQTDGTVVWKYLGAPLVKKASSTLAT